MRNSDSLKPPVAAELDRLGYELVDLEFGKQYGQLNLTVYIFKPGGVDLNDCEKVHGVLDKLLDELDPTDGEPYILNVSSPGLDRPIVTADDVRRAVDTEVEAIVEGRKSKVTGILKGTDGNGNIILLSKDRELVLNKEEIKVLRPHIKF